MTDEALVWNRAALENGGSRPGPGDLALASLLLAHGLIVNGGVLHSIETLTPDQLAAASDGYRYYGFVDVPPLLIEGSASLVSGDDPRERELKLDREYGRLVPNDAVLISRFGDRFRGDPTAFAPLSDL